MNLAVFVVGLLLTSIGVYCSYRHRELNKKYNNMLEDVSSPYQQSQVLRMWSEDEELEAMIRGMWLFQIGTLITVAGVLL